ncbi:T9SS type A sorting domain-containing protein [Paracrocinitomix mangrovi]|uniref:T9SS type A sorting domain-containing protein n=1 Tax=Paracrocinitomix mangrovi TaxID=2862509 RepID=UPI001C8DB201|nr:T9SS type A sorting domain-containing protein [Paracrocinitomix mangrovi]UKN03649.1 T9SS type A sorting domain-containing protein [Paracrocinitomix mangrovi]
MNKAIKILGLSLAFLLGSVQTTFSQATCAGATPLTPGSTQCGTNSFAGSFPDGSTAPLNPCSSSYNDGEYWFSYTGTGQALQLDVSGLTATWSGIFVLDNCPASSPNCVASHTNGGSTANYSITTPALTNGATYYIVIANWSSPYSTAFCLDATVTVPPTPPANDECSGAINVPVNPDFSCSSVASGTINLATASSQNTASCGGTEDDDVWFSFTATGTTHTIDLINITNGTTDLYHSVWTGTCPSLTVVAGSCSDPNSSTLTGLTPGTTYYVRVYSWTSTSGQTTDFDICIGTPPPPPANDECSGATPVTVNPDQNCGSVTPGTIASATASAQNTASCGGTEDDDVWFSFTATSSQHYIDLLNITGGTTDLYHSVWEGTCPALTLVTGSCSDPNSSTVTGLTPGNTYYVRVYSWTSTTGQTSSFDICIGSDPTPTCTDGIQNQGETGVDCGGPCPACPPPSCVDGIQNQNETGIDCGGVCPVCPPQLIPTACANVSYTLTTQSSVSFYDDGGPGGDPCADVAGSGNYCNCNCFTTVTICGAAGEFLVAQFYEFAMWNTTSGWDWMKIYDGPNTASTVLYDNSASGPDNPFGDCGIGSTNMEFCSTGNCLTFEFWATSVVNRAGWDALVTSVIDPCVLPLPIELDNLTATCGNGKSIINWTTYSEQNNDFYTIESSTDGVNYTAVGKVDGAGTSSSTLQYTFTDKNPEIGVNYYRLRQTDFNGKISYSDPVAVNCGESLFSIYPNPTENTLNVSGLGNLPGNYKFELTDMLGRILYSSEHVTMEDNTQPYVIKEFQDFTEGTYILRVVDEYDNLVQMEYVVKL